MSKLLEKHAPLLGFLAKCSNTEKNGWKRDTLVNRLSDTELKAIVECNHNVIKGTVPLSKAQLARCKLNRSKLLELDNDNDLAHLDTKSRKEERRKKRIRILTDRDRKDKKKKKQTGGILPLVLAPVLSAIIGPILKAGIGAVSSGVKSRQIRKVHEKQHKEHMNRLKKHKKKQ